MGAAAARAQHGEDLLLAERFQTPDRAVRVEADGVERLPAAVADACLLIDAEAMTNAARHSGARRVTVRVGLVDGWAHLQVSDDGAWSHRGEATGIGLTSMRERATAIGGTFDVTTGPEGTRVQVVIPAGRPLAPSDDSTGPPTSSTAPAPSRTVLEEA